MKRSRRAPLADAAALNTTTASARAPSFTSARRDRRGPRGPCPRRDEIAVPVEAVLGHALERRVVDVDDPEPLRVSMRPLEVVQQTPHEGALHGRAVAVRPRDSIDVRLEVRRPLRIVDEPVTPGNVTEGRAVHGSVD